MYIAKNTHSKNSHVTLALLFIITSILYGGRGILSIAGDSMSDELNISATDLGVLFSAFSWSYVALQIPGGRILDKFGANRVYFFCILMWSVLMAFHVISDFNLLLASPFLSIVILRIIIGVVEAPAFPANSRIVADQFPVDKRGFASSVFSSAQYFSVVVFAPLLAWLTHNWGWKSGFMLLAVLSFIVLMIWPKCIDIRVDNEQYAFTSKPISRRRLFPTIWTLLRHRVFLGVCLGQYCTTAITFFFLTWFPVYLIQDKGMDLLQAGGISAIPAICGFVGNLLGGRTSDALLRRGVGLNLARKVPIITGMLLSRCMVITPIISEPTWVVTIMSMAFFGKGFGGQGWALISDIAPKSEYGLCGGIFNTFGNLAGIVTPIVIGFLVAEQGSFDSSLIYVGIHGIAAILCFSLIARDLSPIEIK